jgi:very-short-patch-repair endonuclease
MRVAACLRVIALQRSNNGRVNNVGKREGAYFSKLEQEMGWNGVYFSKCGSQHFVDHAGYFVDYYEPFYNIVVEYDEPRHYRHGRLREKDLVRMEQIKAHLGCEFWRYDAYRKQLLKF